MTRPLRTSVLALAAIALGLLVVGGILLAGRVGVPDATPNPAITATPSPSPSASAATADPLATPEGAVRTFFAVLADARRTDEPSPLLGLVTGPASSAYLTASGFLEGQKASGIASVLTVNELSNLVVVPDGLRATVTFLHRQTGFDVDLTTGQPKESPTALADVTVRVVVVRTGDRWLVDAFENVP